MLSYPEYTTQYSLSKGGFPSKVLHRLSGWAPLRRAIHPSSNSTTSNTHSISTLSLSLSLFPGANSIGFACHTFTPIPKHLRRQTHRISTLFFLLIRKPFRVLKNLSNIVVAGLGHIVFARCEGFARIRKTKRWLRNKPIAKASGWGGGGDNSTQSARWGKGNHTINVLLRSTDKRVACFLLISWTRILYIWDGIRIFQKQMHIIWNIGGFIPCTTSWCSAAIYSGHLYNLKII